MAWLMAIWVTGFVAVVIQAMSARKQLVPFDGPRWAVVLAVVLLSMAWPILIIVRSRQMAEKRETKG